MISLVFICGFPQRFIISNHFTGWASGNCQDCFASSFHTQSDAVFSIAHLLLVSCSKSGALNVDLDLLDGAGVGEWRLVVGAHRRAVIHPNVEALPSKPKRNGFTYSPFADLLVVNEKDDIGAFCNTAVRLEIDTDIG